MYKKRNLEKFFKKASQQFPVMLVTGPRQVGKTTFLQHEKSKGMTYVTLDDPMVLSLAKKDPALFMQRFRPPVLIDEIQYAPELFPHIKMEADRVKKSSMFWLTGSQQFHLMKHVSETLAGRVGIINLLGLSRREWIDSEAEPFLPTGRQISNRLATAEKLTLGDVYALIWKGSFPALVLNKNMDRNLFFSSYVQTCLQRDIRDLSKVGDEMAFLRFLRTCAARTGQMVNLADMARDTGISPNTAKNWLSILQASGIVYLLESWHNNLIKRIVKTPKLYFLDTGLCAYLTEWSSPETLEAGAMSGAILETWIFGEILKSYWHNGRHAPLSYYRDKEKREIDLLIVQDGTVFPLEFKKTASPSRDDARHFAILENLNVPVGPGGVICLTGDNLPLTEKAQAIPVSVL